MGSIWTKTGCSRSIGCASSSPNRATTGSPVHNPTVVRTLLPVWGIWLEDDLFCFGTSRSSRKGKNLAANPAVVVHAESGDDVVILEGVVEELTDRDLLRKYADAYDAKYAIIPETDQDADSDGVTYVLRPDEVLAWTEHDFLKTPTRWRFDRN